MKLFRPIFLLTCLTLLVVELTGCVYYNTFYNARKEFNAAEKLRKQSGTGSQASYTKAIEKSLKVLDDHPNSKYYDDALYVVGASYYHTKQYSKAERRFRELLANFPESEYAKQSMLYLAQSKLRLADHDAAIEIFGEIFDGSYDKEFKADAAMELGLYHLEEKEQERARSYFLAIRDSLGNDVQRLEAQRYLADSYYEQFDFPDALKSYLQILGMKPDKNQKYHALTRAAVCSYRLQRINAGLDYLRQLSKDQLYYDSLGAVQLVEARGYEYMGDLAQAEDVYEDIILKAGNNNWVTEANYQLGLIYQFDYDNLPEAKKYYDKAARGNQQMDAASDAVQRSADIAKLQMIEAKQKANREAEEKARAEAEKKKTETPKQKDGAPAAVDSSGTVWTKASDTTSVHPSAAGADSLFRTVDQGDSSSAPVARDTNAATAPSPDSSVVDTTHMTTSAGDSLRTDTLVSDTTGIPHPTNDSTRSDSLHSTTGHATNDPSLLAKQSQALMGKKNDSGHAAVAVPATPPKSELTPAEKARLDSIAAEKERMAVLESDADIIYQLAELYWFQLNKPDSAIAELKGLIRDYPTTSFAPRAMLALSTMYREHLSDTLGADSILQEAYERYASTDYAGEILRMTGRTGSGSERGYPEYYFHLAEDYLIDSGDVASARYYYQYVIDSFPNSSLGVQARFSLAYMLENYESPGDSSVIFAYEAIIDSFPDSPQAQEAKKRITFRQPVKRTFATPEAQKGERDEVAKPGQAQVAQPLNVEQADTARYVDPKEKMYVGPKEEPLILLDIKPIETRVEFDYPAEATNIESYQIEMYFQIRLDFSGKVNDVVLKAPSPNDEINRRALNTVGSMSFDPLAVNKELTRKSVMITLPEEMEDPNGRWYVFKYIVEKPDYLR